jgi:hypothetical protein
MRPRNRVGVRVLDAQAASHPPRLESRREHGQRVDVID